MPGKLTWYLQRLKRMGPAEIAFRVREQARRWSDRRRSFGWEGFPAFPGELRGLPGLRLGDADETRVAAAIAVRDKLLRRELCWLGQAWPRLGDDWLSKLWTLDPVSGSAWPGAGAHAGYRDKRHRGDVKFVWEPNRLQMLQPLALLAAHGDRGAEQLGWDILAAWMAANPPYGGVNWSSGIEAASRVVSVLVFLAGASPAERATHDAMLRQFLAAHARLLWRYPSLHSSANNHRVSELAALLVLQLCAPGLTLRGLDPATTLAALETEVTRQFRADGVGAEQSPTYAAYSIEWFTLAGIVAEASGLSVSARYRERLGAAVEHLQWLFDEGGHPPRIGDDDEGRVLALNLEPEPRYPASVAAMTARWLGTDSPDSDPALRDLTGPVQAAPAIARSGTRQFADGGYTVRRWASRKGQLALTFDHGPLGFLSIAAHGHADALSLWLSWGDEPVLVDAGTYLYHAGGSRRDQLRGTLAHNTLSIDGTDQSRIVGPFAWADHARTELVSTTDDAVTARCLGWHKRFGVVHERRVAWTDERTIMVEDRLVGSPNAALTWRSGLSLAPGCSIDLDGARATVRTAGGRGFTLISEGAAWERVPAVYSPAFNRLVDIDRLELSGRTMPGQPHAGSFRLELEA
jgi:hypothetical protein